MCCYDSAKAHCNAVTTSDMKLMSIYVEESINSNGLQDILVGQVFVNCMHECFVHS